MRTMAQRRSHLAFQSNLPQSLAEIQCEQKTILRLFGHLEGKAMSQTALEL